MNEAAIAWPTEDPIVPFSAIGATNSQGIQFEGSRGFGLWLVSGSNMSGYTNHPLADGRLRLMGHNARKSPHLPPPDLADQPLRKKDGSLTENGKFVAEIEAGGRPLVEVFRKVGPGRWMNHGVYRLTSFEEDMTSGRRIFWFHAERQP